MLEAIHVENYRGIREGIVEKMGAVNLFIGPNGSGKSSLLEAIFFWSGRSGLYGSMQLTHSGKSTAIIPFRHNEETSDTVNWWYAKDPSRPLKIHYTFGGKSYSWHLLDRGGGLRNEGGPFQGEAHVYFKEMKLLDPRLLLDRKLEQVFWDQLLNQRGDRVLIDVMNESYDLGVEGFTYSTQWGVLKVLVKNLSYALNVDDLGAGMRVAFRLFAAIALSRKSAVLVEEVDSFQHVESLSKVAQIILKLAASNNTQIFLTTHSMESVEAFINSAFDVAGTDLRIFRTALSKDGEFTAAALTAEEARLLNAAGLDPRRSQ